MKIFKIKFEFFCLLAIIGTSVFFTSCEREVMNPINNNQDQIKLPQEVLNKIDESIKEPAQTKEFHISVSENFTLDEAKQLFISLDNKEIEELAKVYEPSTDINDRSSCNWSQWYFWYDYEVDYCYDCFGWEYDRKDHINRYFKYCISNGQVYFQYKSETEFIDCYYFCP